MSLYEGQPLYGDVAAFLAGQVFMHHKLLGIGGRTLHPFPARDMNAKSQNMWSDAVFIRDIQNVYTLPTQQLIKMGILAMLYGSDDIEWCGH